MKSTDERYMADMGFNFRGHSGKRMVILYRIGILMYAIRFGNEYFVQEVLRSGDCDP